MLNVSIIIPVINEASVLRLTIKRAWASGAAEVIVADGGSQDETRAIASNENCILVTSSPGRGMQMNAGAAVAGGDVLLFLHADNWLTAGACFEIESAFANSKVGYGGFKQEIDNKRLIYRLIEAGNYFRAKWQGLLYGDQAIFMRRDLFERLGGFPDIEIMEDFEFSRQLRREGKPVILQGPTFVSDRRWARVGVVRQTLRNWFLATAYRLGATSEWIAKRYRRHDK